MFQESNVKVFPTPEAGGFGRQLRAALVALLVLTLITGVVYPLVITSIAQLVFPRQANGSLLVDQNGQARGSRLIGQPFDSPNYFWGRPSATGAHPYNAFNAENLTASGGSNLGPINPALVGPEGTVQSRITVLQAADPGNTAPIPVDLVTASGSGLDPHISPAAAEYQAPRVARERGIDEQQVRELMARFTEGRDLGFLGEPRVNILQLNLALDGVETR